MFLGPPSSAPRNPTVARQWTEPAVSPSPNNSPWKVDSEGQGLEVGLGQRAARELDLGCCSQEPTPRASRLLSGVVVVGASVFLTV